MRKFGLVVSLNVSIFIGACTICPLAFAADLKTDGAGKSSAATLSEDILSQFKNPDMTHRPGGRYDGVYAKDKIAEQLVAGEVEITSESSMGNLEMASGSISTMRAVYEAANKYGISVMVKPNKNDNYSQGLHHAAVENTTGLAKGDKIVGTNLMTGSLIEPALQMVLAVRYTLDGKGRKLRREVVDLGTGDFTFSYVEGEASGSGRGGFPPQGGGGGFPGGNEGVGGPGMGGGPQGGMLPESGMPDGTRGPGGEGGVGGPPQGGMPGGPGGPGFAATRDDTVTVTYNGSGLRLDTGMEGRWDIVAFYTGYDPDQGMLDHPDYYSKEGLAIIKTAILESFGLDENAKPTTEDASALKAAMRENAGYSQAIITSDGGDFNTTLSDCAWSSGLVAKIRALYGYDFIDYMPIQYCGFTSGSDLTDQQIQNDWKEAFSYLCADYFRELDRWSKEIWGAGFRAQIGFAGELDTGILTPALSTPDTESYWPSSGAYDNNYDVTTAYTQVTSGSHILRRKVTSNVELGANKGIHSTPYVDFLLKNANRALYGGVNNMIYHVYSSQVGGSFATPGGVGPYAVWTYVEPQWSAIDDFNGSIARVQYIMQTGTAQRDIALYYHVYDTSASDYVSYAVDDSIEEAGYTYDIVNPGYMDQKNFYAEDGVIDPTGGRYKALVVYRPLTIDKNVETRVWNNWDFGYSWNDAQWESKIEGRFISLDTANQFLDFAKKGVPVIVVGDYNSFYDMNTDRAEGGSTGTDKLRAIFKQIDEMGKLYTAGTISDVTETLERAGIQPDVRKDAASRIVSWKQNFSTTGTGVEGVAESSSADFYWLFNYPCGDPEKEFVDKDWNMAYDKGKTITQTLYFKGRGVPYRADLWSGELTPVANYEVTDDGYIAIEVTLEAYDTAMYCIVHGGEENVHAADLGSDCFYRYDKNGDLYLCTFKGGTYTVKLGNGKTATVPAADAAPPVNLTDWDLSIESWTSNFGYSRSDVMDAPGKSVQKDMLETVEVSDLGSQTWNTFGTFTIKETGEKIDAASVSGVGTYTAAFDIGENADGAILSIGKVYDTVQLWVNDRKVGINMNTLDADISDYLVKGGNTVKIAVASDLQNVCVYNEAYTSSFQDQDGEVESLQAYGMGGPVTVTPYVKVAVK